MATPLIIGFSGKKGSGKSTSVKFLAKNASSLWPRREPYPPTTGVYPMAGPLKKLCVDVLGLLPKQVYGTEEQKNTLTRYRWEDMPHYPRILEKLRHAQFAECYLPDCDMAEVYARVDQLRPQGFMTARQVLQELGTGVFRQMHKDVWIEANIRAISNSGVAVAFVDDIRFPDEVQAIQKAGGVVYRFTRDPAEGKDRHASEISLDRDVFDWNKFDAVIDNAYMNVIEQNCELVKSLYRDGMVDVAVQLCDCCDGLDPIALEHQTAA